MRLVLAEISDFRRFAGDHKVELDASLLAIVGPNEAGKSSLLEVLRRLDDEGEIAETDRSRRITVDHDSLVLEVQYLVEAADHDALSDLDGGDSVRWFNVYRYGDGDVTTSIVPQLERDIGPRRQVGAIVGELRSHVLNAVARIEKEEEAEEEEGSTGPSEQSLTELAEVLESEEQTLSAAALNLISGVRDALAELPDELGLDRYREKLAVLYEHEANDHPTNIARERLWARRPRFLYFDDDSRQLDSEYDLGQVAASPPAALANLARLAGLDLAELSQLLEEDNSGEVKDMLDTANERLEEEFRAWSQSEVTVSFDSVGEQLVRLHVSNAGGGWSKLDERSDGLKMFVALVALTSRRDEAVPPVVLIDEIEQHLHYDAQADLIQVFARQETLPQIIYTTHSAGALPEDLGFGVRVIAPIRGTNTSRIVNRFWSEDVGLSPLLLGMGASTLAFVPIREAVLTEGPSDLILLPTLFREATGQHALGFQIAPAAPDAPAARIAGLELEAPKVAWLTDGDEGGRSFRARLRGTNVPNERIVSIGGPRSELVLEDLIARDVYIAAVNEELRRSGIDKRIRASDVRGKNRPLKLRTWCQRHDLREPTKVNVANRILDQRLDHPLVAADRLIDVRTLYAELRRALGHEDVGAAE